MSGSRPEDLLREAITWLNEGRGTAVVTVIETWGSAPQPVGSKLIVDEHGHFAGSVSGGCVEGAVITEAKASIKSGEHKVLSFGVSNGDAWSLGLACGGTIRVLVEPILKAGDKHQSIEAAINNIAARQPLTREVNLTSGAERLDPTANIATVDADAIFREHLLPPPRIIAIGAVHITQVLSTLARAAGFDLMVVDPRTAFASPERLPGTHLDTRWPATALADIGIDRQTAICALTHDPKLDDPALIAALESDAFYIGALGSRKTRDARHKRLVAEGVATPSLERIHAPIGLDVGAVGAPEIAIAIMAEVIATWRGQLPKTGVR